MNTILLLIGLLGLLIFGYQISDRSISSPIVLFLSPFVIAISFGLIFFYSDWDYNFSIQTVFVVLVSAAAFTLTCCLIHWIFNGWSSQHVQHPQRKIQAETTAARQFLPDSVYWVLICTQIGLIFFLFKYERNIVTQYGYGGSILEVANGFNTLTKFSGSDEDFISGLASPVFGIMDALQVFAAYSLAREVISEGKNFSKLALLNVALSAAYSLLGGGRTGLVGMVFMTLIFLVIFGYKNGTILSFLHLKIKYVAISITGVIIFLIIFYNALALLGRTVEFNFLNYIGIYLAAPFKNFDIMMESQPPDSASFGQYTFSGIYQILSHIVNIDRSSMPTFTLPFVTYNGHSLGNVYTVFRALVLDFGILGCILAITVMAAISQLVYEIAMRHQENYHSNFSMLIYGVVSFNIAMSFFSHNFFQNLFSGAFVKQFLIILLLSTIYNYVVDTRAKKILESPSKK